MAVETVQIPRKKYEALKQKAELLENSRIYKRLLEFEENILKDKKYTRKDLGF